MFELLGTALVLLIIVWIVYRYYGSPESEYMKVLKEMQVKGFGHLDTETIEKKIERSEETLRTLEADIVKTKRRRAKKRLQTLHRIESAQLSLLKEELQSR